MQQAARDVLAFIEGMRFTEFARDKRTRYAVERQLIVIGEASRRVTEGFQLAHPEIPWSRIIGLRNVLAHDYGEVLVERVWLVAVDHLPSLVATLDTLVPDAPGHDP